MTYDAESNSIIIDKSKAKYGKYEIEIKIVDSRFAQYSSTFEIDIQKPFVGVVIEEE